MSTRRNRKIISYILSIILTILMSLFLVLTITRLTITNPSYLLGKMDSVNLYEQARETLNEHIQQETQSTGFPLEMFENYIDTSFGDDVMKDHLKDALNGETTLDTSLFEERLTTDINTYLTSANIIINTEQQIAVDSLKANLLSIYQTYMTFPALTLIATIISTFNSYYPIVAIVLCILIALTAAMIYRLYHDYRKRRRYYCYALSSSGLMCLALPAFIYLGKYIDRLSLSPKYFYQFVTSTLNQYVLIFIIVGLVFIIASYSIAFVKFKKKY